MWSRSLPRVLINREELLLSLCRNKKVLHLGCVDYPITEEQIKDNRFLHTKIMAIARDVVGVDIDKEGITLLSKLGIDNIIQADVENLEGLNISIFDVIVAGEIMEHLKNPGLFLKTIKKYMDSNTLLVISVPNAFCLRRFLRIPFGCEKVHPEHFYYFSHVTLSRLLESCGYSILTRSSYFFEDNCISLAGIIERVASLISPNLCEGLVYIAKKNTY